ncbi:hypothetical protein [Brucella sp. 22210]|uniref:hypothetical protein n=1 Tax=Brucella sp. 22210 TaxID=3453892 RepID=UPI003F85C47D
MPIFDIQGPDGASYEIDAPDENAAMSAFQGMSGNSHEQPGYMGDAFSSFAAGVGRGAADLAGLPGTVSDLLNAGGEWAMSQFGLPTRSQVMQQQGIESTGNPLSGENFREGLSAITGGATDYQPQTTVGEYARTVGEFVPGAMVAGANLPNVLRFGVAPAVASETAGQATEGTPLEPYARIAGALLGGAAASRIGNTSVPKVPTAAEIKQSANYGQLNDAMRNTQLTGGAYRQVVGDIWKEAQDFGLTTDLKSRFGGALNDFLKRADQSGGASLYDLELLRRSLRNSAGNTLDKASQALAGRLVDKLDDVVDALSPSQLSNAGRSAQDVVASLKDARQAYRTGLKGQMIEDAMTKAQSAASGVENGLRTEFRKLVNSPRLARNFTNAEREAIRNVAEGNFTTNTLRWLGSFGVPVDQGRNFLGSLSGGGVGATVGGLLGGPVGATVGGFALPAAGTAAKIGSTRSTQNLANIAEALVKSGPQGQGAFSAATAARSEAGRQAILRALLQGQSAGQIPLLREYAR